MSILEQISHRPHEARTPARSTNAGPRRESFSRLRRPVARTN